MDRCADEEARLRIGEAEHLGERGIGGERDGARRSQHHQRQGELRLIDPFPPDHAVQRQRRRCAADRGRPAAEQPCRNALPGGACRQQRGEDRGGHHQRQAKERHRAHIGDLHCGNLKPQQHDPGAKAMARDRIEPVMRARIARREIERKAEQQSGKDHRHGVILAEPRRRRRCDGADRKARHEARQRLARGLGSRRRFGIGEHHLAEQIAREGIEIGRGFALHRVSALPIAPCKNLCCRVFCLTVS